MDIAALSTSMSQSSLAQAVGIKVLSMAKEQAEAQAQNMVQLIQKSMDPNLGRQLDISV
ncbi:YjfB family protein [Paenibacillus sp. YPG26]|uniref:YjfB family protein n=1 Tax=Paenibacillus sp. YPG26 TaxID=2878915 RepID=UPI00204052A6|nr:YjfB family protein [Paenibacillus sp. YPG26]USB34158.1 YjfB family protein [Paenibacillus sp. YPG26]